MSTEYLIDLTASPIHHQRVEFTLLPITESGRYLFEVGQADVKNDGRDITHCPPMHTTPLDVDVTWVEDSTAEFAKVGPGFQIPGDQSG